MNHARNLNNKMKPIETSVCRRPIKSNLLISVLLVFVAVAFMQTFQLGTMRSEAKSIDKDVQGIYAEQEILREQYLLYGNNLSYYFDS